MSLVVSNSERYLGTNKKGEIVFDALYNGVKPLVFEDIEGAWNTLEFIFPDKKIGYDLKGNKAYEIIEPKSVHFMASIKIIKDIVITEIVETEKQCDVCALRKMIGEL